MDQLRKVIEWITHHKILSSIIAVLLITLFVTTRYVLHANAGKSSPPLEKGNIIDAVYGIGTVTAKQRLSFNPLVGNTVREMYVREGDKVPKGTLLAKTEDGNKILAPFDGVVNYLPYRQGENTYTTTPLLVFTDLTDLYVVVSLEQQGALKIKAGQTAKLSFDSLREETYEGKVSAIYSYGNNFLARIDDVKLPDNILPDMTCDVAIVVGTHENVLLLPIVAFDNGKVWVKRGNSLPHAIPVKLGINDGVHAEVLEGDLKPGDHVMIRAQVSP